MALSALDDPSVKPTDEQLAGVLGASFETWQTLCAWLKPTSRITTWQWRHSGAKYGWSLLAQSRKRTMVYLIPGHGQFLVGLVLGSKAMGVVSRTELSPAVSAIVRAAPRYGEGTGFRLPVVGPADLDDVKTLIGIKIVN